MYTDGRALGGANAMRSFEGMGILEVKAHPQIMGTASRSSKFVRGTESHDVIYDVSRAFLVVLVRSLIITIIYSTLLMSMARMATW